MDGRAAARKPSVGKGKAITADVQAAGSSTELINQPGIKKEGRQRGKRKERNTSNSHSMFDSGLGHFSPNLPKLRGRPCSLDGTSQPSRQADGLQEFTKLTDGGVWKTEA